MVGRVMLVLCWRVWRDGEGCRMFVVGGRRKERAVARDEMEFFSYLQRLVLGAWHGRGCLCAL